MEYIIGDVHGCLERLHNLISSLESRGPITRIVFLGDYYDRGPHTRETIDYLLALSKKYDCIFLRGNHDDIICSILGLPYYSNCEYWVDKKTFTPEFAFNWFRSHGLESTLRSYDVFDKLSEDNVTHNVNLFRKAVSDSHKEFLNNTVMSYSTDKYVAYHGYPGKTYQEILWGRYDTTADMEKVTNTGKKIILGHTPVQQYGFDDPIRRGDIILLDTLSFKDYGSLTAYCVDDETFISIT
jgi:serine/threonine protein phosphatase 1